MTDFMNQTCVYVQYITNIFIIAYLVPILMGKCISFFVYRDNGPSGFYSDKLGPVENIRIRKWSSGP